MKQNRFLILILSISISLASFAFCEPIYSPTWCFSMDLPESFAYSSGDGKDKFSFEHPDGIKVDTVVYYTEPGKTAQFASTEALANDVQRRLNNRGKINSFDYRQKRAFIIELSFSVSAAGGRSSPMEGWALCLELGPSAADQKANASRPGNAPPQNNAKPMLLAMAYGPAGKTDLQIMYLSALDSIAPEESDKLAPGPITEFKYPRKNRISSPVFGLDINAMIFKEDAEAAQALIDREYNVLRRYINAPNWKEAWIRLYRAIYRDSFDRLADIAFKVERKFNVPPLENRELANNALKWVQSFAYERDLMGSDFQNLITAAIEGRGDCDSRSMLWAIIMKQASIHSAIMVSRHYSHAMGLADLPGAGAHFEVDKQKFLVAETTAQVDIGLIGETVSEIMHWIGITFE